MYPNHVTRSFRVASVERCRSIGSTYPQCLFTLVLRWSQQLWGETSFANRRQQDSGSISGLRGSRKVNAALIGHRWWLGLPELWSDAPSCKDQYCSLPLMAIIYYQMKSIPTAMLSLTYPSQNVLLELFKWSWKYHLACSRALSRPSRWGEPQSDNLTNDAYKK